MCRTDGLKYFKMKLRRARGVDFIFAHRRGGKRKRRSRHPSPPSGLKMFEAVLLQKRRSTSLVSQISCTFLHRWVTRIDNCSRPCETLWQLSKKQRETTSSQQDGEGSGFKMPLDLVIKHMPLCQDLCQEGFKRPAGWFLFRVVEEWMCLSRLSPCLIDPHRISSCLGDFCILLHCLAHFSIILFRFSLLRSQDGDIEDVTRN